MQSKIIFTEGLPNSIPKGFDYHEQKYGTISSTPIPLSLDESISTVYDNQLKHGIELAVEIVPHKLFRANGYSLIFPNQHGN